MTKSSARLAAVLVAAFSLCNGFVFGDGLTSEELVAAAEKEITSISATQAKEIFDRGEGLFLDVREPDEVKQGQIPRAANIPRGLLEFRIGSVVPEKTMQIVVYCRSGRRSALAAQTLVRMGYTNALSLNGGWLAWQQAGFPRE